MIVRTTVLFQIAVVTMIFFVLDIVYCDGDPPCHVNATCNDIPGSYECNCFDGFTGNGTRCDGI